MKEDEGGRLRSLTGKNKKEKTNFYCELFSYEVILLV